jgi:SAM-dependent methyltransferase
MRRLHATSFDTADSIIQGLANLSLSIELTDRILDFGCGDGALVHRFRELGYDAYGFDIHKYGKLRREDETYFKFFANPNTNTADHRVDWTSYGLPFENDTFDLVISTQTLEHVLEPAPVMAEIARVLRPDGIALHLFPDRTRMIEPHFFVPLATRIQNWWWFYLWSILGVRNSFQHELTARQVADENFRYCQTGVRYFENEELRAYVSPYFEEISFPKNTYYGYVDRRATRRSTWRALRSDNRFANLAPLPKLNVLLTAKKRTRHNWRVLGPFQRTIKGYVGKMPSGLSGLTADWVVLFQDGKLVGPGVPSDKVDALIVAPADWSEQQLATNFDVVPGRAQKLEGPFQAHSGYMFGAALVDLGNLADNVTPGQNGSPVLVFENKVPLGPAHALHSDIVKFGAGRFSHWGSELLFSSSDNSDPRSNGRNYEIVIIDPHAKGF